MQSHAPCTTTRRNKTYLWFVVTAPNYINLSNEFLAMSCFFSSATLPDACGKGLASHWQQKRSGREPFAEASSAAVPWRLSCSHAPDGRYGICAVLSCCERTNGTCILNTLNCILREMIGSNPILKLS